MVNKRRNIIVLGICEIRYAFQITQDIRTAKTTPIVMFLQSLLSRFFMQNLTNRKINIRLRKMQASVKERS